MSTFASEKTDEETESPAERRRRRVRDAILGAAERVFASEGPAGLSIRRLAEEIDYSPSAIYKYFKSKTELMTCLKDAFFERLMLKMKSAQDGGGIGRDGLVRRCAEIYIRTAMERPHHYLAAFTPDFSSDESPLEEEQRIRLMANASAAYDMLKEQVEEGIRIGVFRDDLDADLAANSLWASMHGMANLGILMPDFGCVTPNGQTMICDDFITYHAEMIRRALER